MKPDSEIVIRISRRTVLRCGLYGAAGLLMADRLIEPAMASLQTLPKGGRAKSVIQLWMWGGPAHLDTFDPKPDAGYDFAGAFSKPIETNVKGVQINELMPELAKHADKYSIIRSMTHGNNGHETAAYMVQTGSRPGDRLVHPSVGAVVTHFKGYEAGYKGLIPPYIVLTQLLGRFSEAGFLGLKAKPFATGGDPNASRFLVEGVVAEGISEERQRRRKELLDGVNTMRKLLKEDPSMAAMDESERQAYEMILGDGGKVFDLSTEPEEVRTRYGRNTFGQSCLIARRLVERGVPYVTVNYGGWDTHKENFQTLRRKLPELDKGMSALLQDLGDKGLLDSTIVWWGGEFGRTPRVQWEAPWNGGRGHWGQVFSSVLAGGGFKGGHVVGASDPKGEEVRERPVYPSDLIASVYELLGIDPKATLRTPDGTAVPIVPPAWEGAKGGGRLSEIM